MARYDSLLGAAIAADGLHLRLVERLVGHEPLTFGALSDRVVRDDTRYLVLDLDRTCHLGWNMGELLGWEVIARDVYGERYLEHVAEQRAPGRVLTRWRRPWTTLHYFGRGFRLWALPGLFYFTCGKVATRYRPTRRWLFGRFGPEPVGAVQGVPRVVLLHHLSELPLATLRRLARSVWDRHAPDQVVTAAALAALRARCQGLRIILCSASPQPVVEAAAEALGVDDVVYTEVEEHEGYLSAPPERSRAFFLGGEPRRISPPSLLTANAGVAKIERLVERFPDLVRPDVHAVGITDTSYGEDRAWAHYFDVVVDINSPTPFSPFVAATSPLEAIHTAAVLTRAELAELLAAEAPVIADLAARYAAERAAGAEDRAALAARSAAHSEAIEATVAAYNEATERRVRRGLLRRIREQVHARQATGRELARLERPLSRVACELTRRLDAAREVLEPALAQGPEPAGP